MTESFPNWSKLQCAFHFIVNRVVLSKKWIGAELERICVHISSQVGVHP